MTSLKECAAEMLGENAAGLPFNEAEVRTLIIDLLAALETAETSLPCAQIEKPKVVTLCGSSRFVDVMAVCAWLIERDEHAIAMTLHLLPNWYPNCPDHHLAEHEGCATEMDALHFRKIELSDEIFVVNVGDYIGESTGREIEHTKKLGKPIRWFTHDAVGAQVKEMIDTAISTLKIPEKPHDQD